MRALKAFVRRWLIVIAAGSFAAPAAAQSIGTAVVVYSPPVAGSTSISPLASPFFTGQWTVNGVACTSVMVVQGGSPTTCTADPTVTSLTATTVSGTTVTGTTVNGTWASASESVTRSATSSNIVLTSASTPLQSVVPGANLNVTLPTAAVNMHFSIHNGAAFTITIKDAAAATVTTLVNGQTVNVVYDGTSWVIW